MLYSQLYPVSFRNMLCAFTMFLSCPISPPTVSLWTLLVTSTQSLTCSTRPRMEPSQNKLPTEMIHSQPLKNSFLDEKTAPVTAQAQFKEEEYSATMQSHFMMEDNFVIVQPRFTEEKADPIIVVQQEMEEGSVTLS